MCARHVFALRVVYCVWCVAAPTDDSVVKPKEPLPLGSMKKSLAEANLVCACAHGMCAWDVRMGRAHGMCAWDVRMGCAHGMCAWEYTYTLLPHLIIIIPG